MLNMGSTQVQQVTNNTKCFKENELKVVHNAMGIGVVKNVANVGHLSRTAGFLCLIIVCGHLFFHIFGFRSVEHNKWAISRTMGCTQYATPFSIFK
jgi:hypothetical protein